MLQLLGILALSICCTNPPLPSPQTQEPTPVEITLPPIELSPISELSAADIMQIAFAQYSRGLWEKAAESFRYAIGTGMLNDMGRAVCYWHMADSCEKAVDTDCAAEAYYFFTIVGSDLLHPTDWQHNPLPPNTEFIENFGLRIKLNYATDYINVLWDSRTAP